MEPWMWKQMLWTVGFSVHEWGGLFLIALGMRKHWFAGSLRDATWNLWGGSALGGVAGAIVGGLIDLVRFDMLKESALDGFAVRCWIYGGLLGGVVTGMAFFAYRCSHALQNVGERANNSHKRPIS